MSYPVLPNNSTSQYQPLMDHTAAPVTAPAHAVYVQQQSQHPQQQPYVMQPVMQPVMVQPVIMAQPQPRPNAVVVVVSGQPQPQTVNHSTPAPAEGALASPNLQELPFYGHIADTYRPYAIGVVHKQPLSDSYICFQCCPLCLPCMLMNGDFRKAANVLTGQSFCDWVCWGDKLKPRAYAAVYENRMELNYPYTSCCGCFVNDDIRTRYFDKLDSVKHATCCTPYHLCGCVECSGGVISLAPCDCVNNGCFSLFCCPCSVCCRREFFGGLSDAKAYDEALQAARGAVKNQRRMVRG